MIKIEESWKKENGNYGCPICKKEYSYKGIATHVWHHYNYKSNSGGRKKGCTPWNKGLTKETDSRVNQIAETYSNNIKTGKTISAWKGKKLSKEHIQKLKNKGGGYRKGSGRGKSGWYKGYWCDSSWELAYVIYNLDHDIKFERNKEGFQYQYEGVQHKYYPDFILEDGTLIEIKGYLTKKDKEKHKSCKVKVINKNEIKVFINYVSNKYGNDFLKLYENSKHKPSHKNRIQYVIDIKEKWKDEQSKKIEIVYNSLVDFSKNGWVGKIAEEMNHPRSKIKRWFLKYMPDFYNEKCLKR